MHFGQPHRSVALAASDRPSLFARDRNHSLKQQRPQLASAGFVFLAQEKCRDQRSARRSTRSAVLLLQLREA